MLRTRQRFREGQGSAWISQVYENAVRRLGRQLLLDELDEASIIGVITSENSVESIDQPQVQQVDGRSAHV